MQKYVDDPRDTTGEVGELIVAVRKNSAASLVSADTDYSPLQVDSAGALRVNIASSASGAVDTELTTKDFDSGAGTDTVAVTGIVVPASGGSATVQGDATNGLDVDVTRLPAGEIHLGEIGGSIKQVGVELTRPTPDVTGYTANDAISDSASAPTILTFANAARAAGEGGYIVGARLVTDQAANVASYRIHLFHTTVSAVNDNAAQTILYANKDKRIGHIDIAALNSQGGSSTAANGSNFEVRVPFTAPGTSIFVMLETRAAFTPAAAQKFYIELLIDQT